MVKYNYQELNTIFSALANPTRREILMRLAQSDRPVTELAARFDMSLPAVSKHLRVLEKAGLMVQSKDGRIRQCHLMAGPLKDAAEWIEHYRGFWEGRFSALAQYLERAQPEETS